MCEENVLRENKRECFDGMRAYHQSEINHANHAITILLAMNVAIGSVMIAILFPQNTPSHTHEIAWGLFLVVLVFGNSIAGTAHIKISEDHKIFSSFGVEYVKTSKLLGFYASMQFKGEKHILKTNVDIGQGKGYRKTQAIIWAFAALQIVFTLLFAVTVSYIL